MTIYTSIKSLLFKRHLSKKHDFTREWDREWAFIVETGGGYAEDTEVVKVWKRYTLALSLFVSNVFVVIWYMAEYNILSHPKANAPIGYLDHLWYAVFIASVTIVFRFKWRKAYSAQEVAYNAMAVIHRYFDASIANQEEARAACTLIGEMFDSCCSDKTLRYITEEMRSAPKTEPLNIDMGCAFVRAILDDFDESPIGAVKLLMLSDEGLRVYRSIHSVVLND